MPSLDSLLLVVHLLGMALGVGAAVVKTVLVLRARADLAFVPVLVAARRPVTKTLVAGLALATLSGIVWLVRGYPWTPLLIGKLAVVAAIWVLGPLIDNVFEPRMVSAAPAAGEAPSDAFLAAQRTHATVELVATALMIAALVLGASL